MHDDLKELIESLIAHNVEFIVVGAHALAYYGRPRYTEDLDLFLRRSEANGTALRNALSAFGIPISDTTSERLMTKDKQMIVIGHSPNSVDLMTFLDGVEFEDAWSHKVQGEVLGVTTWILNKSDYIKTKAATGRPKDLLDLEILRELE